MPKDKKIEKIKEDMFKYVSSYDVERAVYRRMMKR